MVFLPDYNFFHQVPTKEESCVSKELFEKLSKYFTIYREVAGTHLSGKKVRIDAVLSPKPEQNFKNNKCFIGLEIKRGDDSVGEITKQISQSVDYSNSNFGDFGFLYVFCYPDPFRGNWSSENTFSERLIGQLGVGFLSESPTLELRLKGHRLWTAAEGAVDAKHWSLKRKFGSK
jgi:hypothetical protein